MPTPTSQLRTLRPDLMTMMPIDLEAIRRGFVGLNLLRPMSVVEQSGNWGEIPLKQVLQRHDTRHSPNAGYNRSDFQFSPRTFNCVDYGHEGPVDRRLSKMYSNYLQVESVTADIQRHIVLQELEIRIAAKVQDVSGSATVSHSAVSTKWNVHASATPQADVLTAMLAMQAACGLWPNTLMITRKALMNVVQCQDWIDKVKYTMRATVGTLVDQLTSGNPAARVGAVVKNQSALSDYFGIETALVANAPYNTANPEQAASISSIWADTICTLAVVAKTDMIQEPCLGRTFHWGGAGATLEWSEGEGLQGLTMESYPDMRMAADIIRARCDTDENLYGPQFGYNLTGIL